MSSAAESFLYIWYDTKNKMYYLGKHKGTPDDSYTHSSTIMESFNKDNIPSYMKRRILAYGTDEEMCLLEHECLKNRKEKKWDRYYNTWLGDPRYVSLKGEDNPFYKHGLSKDPEWKRKYSRKYYSENKEIVNRKKREYKIKNKDEISEYNKEYYSHNKDKILKNKIKYYAKNEEKIRKYSREYYAENRERILEKKWEYRARNKEKYRDRKREYDRVWREKNREKINERQRIRLAKKKAEKLASGATLPI